MKVQKKLLRPEILDKAHVWSVRGLMGLTLAGVLGIGIHLYDFFTYVQPARTEQARKAKELEISTEQSEKEMELMQKQKDAETLVA